MPLLDDEGILEEYEIKGGAKISYIIMIAWLIFLDNLNFKYW